MKWNLIPTAALLVLQKLAYAQQFAVNNSINDINSIIEQELDTVSLEAPILRATTGQNILEKNDNVVLYWGQGDYGEERLSYYCNQEGVSVVIIAFVADFNGGPNKSPVLDLSDNCRNVDNCIEAAQDIRYCQSKGIKTLISVGGAEGPYHKQKWDPDLFAWWMWNKFLGGTDPTVSRPFGDVILDGVDYDPEGMDGAGYDRHIDSLRKLFKTQSPPRDYLISAAPQCPDLEYYKKNAMYNILHPDPKYDAYPDLVFVQFYNNECSASAHKSKKSSKFNYDNWDKWAREQTGGRSKIFLGVLGKENHMDTGYVSYDKLTEILDNISRSKSFGGVMIWDAGYAYSNPVQYLNGVNYGQAAAKYLNHLSTGSASRTVQAFQNIQTGLKEHQVPILVPISGANSELLPPPVPCAGTSFLLLRAVTGRALAMSFGSSADSIEQHLESIGMDGNDFINPGSRICLISSPQSDSVAIGYVYNATFTDNGSSAYY